MIHPFEENYFLTPDKTLLQLPNRQTHIQWIENNRPDDDRESLCCKGWVIIATYRDRHVFQLEGMNYGKLRDIHNILMQLNKKDRVVIQTSLDTVYEIEWDVMCELDGPEQLWSHKMM
jgi:hypothetical protein